MLYREIPQYDTKITSRLTSMWKNIIHTAATTSIHINELNIEAVIHQNAQV